MELLENIRAEIGDFAGYDTESNRPIADEQVRAFVGERLAALPPVEVDTLPPEERAVYDRVLLRAEFMNQLAFRAFEDRPQPERIASLLEADRELIAAAKDLTGVEGAKLDEILQRLERAFDRRDAAMNGA